MDPFEPSLVELRAVYEHAAARVVLYRRRMYLGHGDARRMAELEGWPDGHVNVILCKTIEQVAPAGN